MRVLNIGIKGKNKIIFHKSDKKILELLCYNVRLPISKIAKLLKLSRQSVEYRIKTMEKNHLIAGSRTVINVKKMGYYSYHFFLNLSSKIDEEKFIERCLASKDVNMLISYSGKLNFEVSIMAKSPENAKKIFLDIVKDLDITNYFICILLDGIKTDILPTIISNKKPVIKNLKNDPSFSKQFNLPKKNYNIDKKDKQILYSLSQDAKKPLIYLGEDIKLTKDAVAYRIKNLIQAGYILQFRPVIDYSILNLNIQTVLIRNNSYTKKQEFNDYLRNNKSVLWATEVLGDWDYLMYVINEEAKDIHDFIKEMKDRFGENIQNYEILFAFQEHKYSFMTENIIEDD